MQLTKKLTKFSRFLKHTLVSLCQNFIPSIDQISPHFLLPQTLVTLQVTYLAIGPTLFLNFNKQTGERKRDHDQIIIYNKTDASVE